jgi:hypothetical protein
MTNTEAKEGEGSQPSDTPTEDEISTRSLVPLLDHWTTINLDDAQGDNFRDALGDKQVVAGSHVKEFFDQAGNLVGVWYCDPYSRRECYRGRMSLHGY